MESSSIWVWPRSMECRWVSHVSVYLSSFFLQISHHTCLNFPNIFHDKVSHNGLFCCSFSSWTAWSCFWCLPSTSQTWSTCGMCHCEKFTSSPLSSCCAWLCFGSWSPPWLPSSSLSWWVHMVHRFHCACFRMALNVRGDFQCKLCQVVV